MSLFLERDASRRTRNEGAPKAPRSVTQLTRPSGRSRNEGRPPAFSMRPQVMLGRPHPQDDSKREDLRNLESKGAWPAFPGGRLYARPNGPKKRLVAGCHRGTPAKAGAHFLRSAEVPIDCQIRKTAPATERGRSRTWPPSLPERTIHSPLAVRPVISPT
jgi:hypothetical protein